MEYMDDMGISSGRRRSIERISFSYRDSRRRTNGDEWLIRWSEVRKYGTIPVDTRALGFAAGLRCEAAFAQGRRTHRIVQRARRRWPLILYERPVTSAWPWPRVLAVLARDTAARERVRGFGVGAFVGRINHPAGCAVVPYRPSRFWWLGAQHNTGREAAARQAWIHQNLGAKGSTQTGAITLARQRQTGLACGERTSTGLGGGNTVGRAEP